MTLSDKEILKQLGLGKSIDHIREAYKITQHEFDIWWINQTESRVPNMSGSRAAVINQSVNIIRDKWGIPHIFATDDKDLFFGYGYAMAQDRLWQLDYLRRKALGHLSEILGPDGLESDIAARTIGINRIAASQIKQIPSRTFQRLERFSLGINEAIEEYKNHLPIEFDLLDYEPKLWSPLDSVAIWVEFRWYLTGRLPVISIPEIAKRVLGSGTLYQAFLCGEADNENILHHGVYPSEPSSHDPVGESISDPSEGLGSNNWVVSGERSASHLPMVASDPHIAFGSTSCWYEVHLSSDLLNVAGTGYAGVPMILFGRNEQVAWGLTNNICSQRDLYKEQINDQYPGCFLYDGQWEQSKQISERIKVKGQDIVHKTIRFSRNGPIVDKLLPLSAKNTGPVSLRWLGQDFSDELSCMLLASEARNCEMFKQALKEWKVPTWSVGFADVHGDIGYQCIGRIPIRHLSERGYKPGWDPQYQWKQQIPFENMPTMSNPEAGWIRSANNRTAPNDFPYPLSGTWASGYRAARIRNMLEKTQATSKQDFARMQTDCLSLRAIDGVPELLSALSSTTDRRLKEAISHLKSWDRRMETDRVGASIFELFFNKWTGTVAKERFHPTTVSEIAGSIAGLALALLADDNIGWFTTIDRVQAITETFREVIADLESRLGEDMSSWTWGRLHTIKLAHPLSKFGDLSQLLNRGGQEVGGNGITVCNTGYDPNYMAAMGANYRLIADLADSPPGLWAVDAAGQSGHPGSTHYCDQLPDWLAGRHHYLTLDKDQANADAINHFTLIPQTS